MALFTGLGLTPEQKQLRDRNSEAEQCVSWRNTLVATSPIVRFMMEKLAKAGCPFDVSTLPCEPCDEMRAGGFSPDIGVQLCQNRFFDKTHMEDTLAHELVHAYDHCVFKVDWSNCYHHACSEIRAASLSGDCRFTREFARGNVGYLKQHQKCVKRRALLSVLANPSCQAPGQAERAVNAVFESCFNDTTPFREIY
ncbi:mitochondrial inner membrane protease ATP23 [Ramicandelaber brevisporus]|nr:mitochondrial inner membrane protease ATP23 [Ramicandelaber brevisporus]